MDGKLSYCYYYRRNKEEKLPFQVDRPIFITGISIFSLDKDHKSCYPYPVKNNVFRIYEGKEANKVIFT